MEPPVELSVPVAASPALAPTAQRLGFLGCHACGLLSRSLEWPEDRAIARSKKHSKRAFDCRRCGTRLHARKPNSLQRTWAYLWTAAILFVPAMLCPVMTVKNMGSGDPQTIASGVVHLITDGQLLIGSIVLVASILIPLLKLIGLALLLLSITQRWRWSPHRRVRLFRFIEFIGRWSMLDIFVVALLVALVRFDAMASVEPGLGATAFAAVVILTMFATTAFDPRLIWDALEEAHEES